MQPINDYSKKIVENRWRYAKSFKAAMEKILADKFAILCDETVMYEYISKNAPCKMTKMAPTVFQGPVVWPWKKNFAYGQIFSF